MKLPVAIKRVIELVLQRIFLASLLFLVFAGQVAAVSMKNCEMTNKMSDLSASMNHSNKEHTGMKHSSMNHASMNHSEQSNMAEITMSHDCCDPEGSCFMGSSISGMLPLTIQQLEQVNLLSHKFSALPKLRLTQFNSSLYRPPISH